MKEEKRYLTLDRYRHGALCNVLNVCRSRCLQEGKAVDYVNEVLVKAANAPTGKVRRCHER